MPSETLIYSLMVIASEARQSSALNKSTVYGSPRRCALCDDAFFSVPLAPTQPAWHPRWMWVPDKRFGRDVRSCPQPLS